MQGKRTQIGRAVSRHVVLIALVALVAAPAAFGLVAEQPVLNSTRNETRPSADWNAAGTVDYLAYSKSRRFHPHRYDAYLRLKDVGSGTASTVKLNTRGQGFAGGVDAPMVLYQQVVSGQSNLKLYDIDTGVRSSPPGVNTARWECCADLSGDYILFTRQNVSRPVSRVILHQVSTGVDTRLALTTSVGSYTEAGRIDGNWAVYFKCAPICNVFRHDIAANVTTKLPKPQTSSPRDQYAPSVASSGVVYLARAGRRCGSNVKLVRFFGPSDPATGTVVATLPAGYDVGRTDARENADGSVDVHYDRARCSTGRLDVYKITDGP
jgi:hypothetical protein